ncbi:uncharacterized protein HMPREF1541_02537 [Cyphellophora europaea CBS 101466]|uniref:Xylanolytic transcriptional activator regulatory domain-containing protein n=1 Tax=Cyphellophora europaea (strain CBS 101466) TaxID=1220924 RepID=W2S5T6_CYPE1|nr:uncharacterized protein HMPREF1541_02537 [Cyphellophora europaea CBS 101466]ETN43378.1 hypothetical protein HMPREF1541_02537 [Cyphellophora europaea CBS 101466]
MKDRLTQLEDLIKSQRELGVEHGKTDGDSSTDYVDGPEIQLEESLLEFSSPALDNPETGPEIDLRETFSSSIGDSTQPNDVDEGFEDGDFKGAAFLLQLPIVLPPALQAWDLLQEYLVDFNKALPLFDEERLVSMYRNVFSQDPKLDCLDLKAVYATLAIAYRLRAMSPLASDKDDHNAKSFIEQTFVALPRMLVARPSLPSAQYITAMAVVMHGTRDSQGTRSLLAAALRMLLDLSSRSLSYDEHQAQRVFWIAFMMDTDLAIRNGQWSSNVFFPPNTYELASSSLDAGILPMGRQSFPYFRHRAQLAKIQARLLRLVGIGHGTAASSHALPNQKMLTSLQSIAADLSAWRLREPLFQAYPKAYRHKLHRSDLVHLTVLEATFFSTYFALQGALQGIGPFRGSVMLYLQQYCELDMRGHVDDAVRLLSLFDYLPHGDFACVWLVIDAIVIAVYVLLGASLHHPYLLHLEDTSQAISGPLQLLRHLAQKHSQKRLLAAYRELERLNQVIGGCPET